ncbi:MAG: acyl-CoA dehydrogenase family protein [Nitriliruptoraceae bacterium]
MLKFDPEAFATESALPLFLEEHEAYRAAARDFVDGELTPHVESWEDERDYPRAVFRTVASAGHFGAKFDPQWGGAGPDLAAGAVWCEEVARCGSAGLVADLRAHAEFACMLIDRYGTEEQKQRYLAPSIAGDLIGGFGVIDLDDDGVVEDVPIRAKRDGDDWVLDGTDALVMNGSWADYVVLAAGTDVAGAPDGRETTFFIVDSDTAGLAAQRAKLGGWRTSHTGELSLAGVRVSDANRLGAAGDGAAVIADHLAWERVVMALEAVTTADAALAAAIAFARDRQAFGRPVSSFQVWQHRFSDLATEVELGRSLSHHALRLYVAAADGQPVEPSELARVTSMAKLYGQRMARRVADECVQVHGGAGYLMEYTAQRYWRDTRLGSLGGGTDDTMRDLVADTYGLR